MLRRLGSTAGTARLEPAVALPQYSTGHHDSCCSVCLSRLMTPSMRVPMAGPRREGKSEKAKRSMLGLLIRPTRRSTKYSLASQVPRLVSNTTQISCFEHCFDGGKRSCTQQHTRHKYPSVTATSHRIVCCLTPAAVCPSSSPLHSSPRLLSTALHCLSSCRVYTAFPPMPTTTR